MEGSRSQGWSRAASRIADYHGLVDVVRETGAVTDEEGKIGLLPMWYLPVPRAQLLPKAARGEDDRMSPTDEMDDVSAAMWKVLARP